MATPLEAQISGVDNMNYMYSVNANNGQTQITVNFDIRTDPNIDQVLTQLRTSQAQSQLPAQVNTAGLIVQKSLSSPLMLIALYSPKGSYDSIFLANYAYINLVDELTRVPGVARVQVFGAGQYAMRCLGQSGSACQAASHRPADHRGAAIAKHRESRRPDRRRARRRKASSSPTPCARKAACISPEEFGNIILRANPDGSICGSRMSRASNSARSSTISRAATTASPPPFWPLSAARLERRASRRKRPRSASRSSKSASRRISTYRSAWIPRAAVTAGMREIVVHAARSAGARGVRGLHLSAGLARHAHSAAAVPVSLIGTFVIFPLLGFSINTLSLFGLVLAIGLVVDDAIVVVEAVERHIEEGYDSRVMPPSRPCAKCPARWSRSRSS